MHAGARWVPALISMLIAVMGTIAVWVRPAGACSLRPVATATFVATARTVDDRRDVVTFEVHDVKDFKQVDQQWDSDAAPVEPLTAPSTIDVSYAFDGLLQSDFSAPLHVLEGESYLVNAAGVSEDDPVWSSTAVNDDGRDRCSSRRPAQTTPLAESTPRLHVATVRYRFANDRFVQLHALFALALIGTMLHASRRAARRRGGPAQSDPSRS